jgi:hypothetical protein
VHRLGGFRWKNLRESYRSDQAGGHTKAWRAGTGTALLRSTHFGETASLHQHLVYSHHSTQIITLCSLPHFINQTLAPCLTHQSIFSTHKSFHQQRYCLSRDTMSSVTSSTPVMESKSAKKRKTKGNASSPAPVETTDVKVNGTTEADGDSHYLKELQK